METASSSCLLFFSSCCSLSPPTTHHTPKPVQETRSSKATGAATCSGGLKLDRVGSWITVHRSPTHRRATAGGGNHSRRGSSQPPPFLDWLTACDRAGPSNRATSQARTPTPLSPASACDCWLGDALLAYLKSSTYLPPRFFLVLHVAPATRCSTTCAVSPRAVS